MLELLVTSHGSSEPCGVKKGTGCSRGLRAINVPDEEDSIGPKREKEKKKKGWGGKAEKRKEGKEVRVFLEKEKSTPEVSVEILFKKQKQRLRMKRKTKTGFKKGRRYHSPGWKTVYLHWTHSCRCQQETASSTFWSGGDASAAACT